MSKVCQTCGGPLEGRSWAYRKYCSRECAGNTKHGMCTSPEYIAWRDMRRRCQSTWHHLYQRYGARGITICERWLGRDGFQNFYADMGPRANDRLSLERIDNDGNYEPSNCKWATKLEQGRNRGVVWTEAQLTALRKHLMAGRSYEEIAETLGKTVGGVENRAYRLKLSPRRLKKLQSEIRFS